MSTAIQCPCGATLPVAPNSEAEFIRCAECGNEVRVSGGPPPAKVAPAAADVFPYAAHQSGVAQSCPICRTDLQPGESVCRCPDCEILHHEECWAEIGGCGTFGCARAPAIDKSEQTVQAPLTAWGDTKDCPVCGEKIKSIAIKCRYCGMEFGTVDPLTAADLRDHAIKRGKTDKFKQTVVVQFGLSLIGILAPLCLIFGLIYLVPRRQQLAKCGPIFAIMGWASIGLSSIYCLLLILVLLVSGTL